MLSFIHSSKYGPKIRTVLKIFKRLALENTMASFIFNITVIFQYLTIALLCQVNSNENNSNLKVIQLIKFIAEERKLWKPEIILYLKEDKSNYTQAELQLQEIRREFQSIPYSSNFAVLLNSRYSKKILSSSFYSEEFHLFIVENKSEFTTALQMVRLDLLRSKDLMECVDNIYYKMCSLCRNIYLMI